MSDTRRFDQMERVVRDTRRELDDLRATVLARMGSHTHGSGVDHGALSGLADDDHPQYRRVDGTVPVTTANHFDLQTSHKATGDSDNRHEVFADGYMKWGPGNAVVDTVLYRNGAGELKTDGDLTVADTLTVTGTITGGAVGMSRTTYVTADQTKNNNTTLATILSLSVLANAKYAVEGFVFYTGNATADIKFGWTGPSGYTMLWSAWGAEAADDRIAQIDTGALDQTFALTTAGDNSGIAASARPAAYLVTSGTAGTLALQFAQSTANASNTIVKAGSWLRVTRLA